MARILVIDDNPAVLQSLGFFLEAAGHTVFLAASGEAGLRCATGKPIDLVLLDIEMPGMSGFAICSAMRDDATLREVPVVMMTGRLLGEVTGPAKNAGARMVIGKPFDLELLHATIARNLAPGAPPSGGAGSRG